MKFGIFYELQLPRPWEPGGELRLYQNALDQVELADRLGYDYAWEVEHHFLEEYSHSPAPEVFLGAASQRTKNIRLAHGIMQLTTSPPARVRRAHRRPRPGQPRPGRFRHGRERQQHRTRTVRPRLRRKARGVGRRGPRDHPDVQGWRLRISRPLFRFSVAQRRAEAGAKAAPAIVVRLLAIGDDRDGRPPRARRARLSVFERRGGACLGPRLLQRLHQAPGKARRLRDQPEFGADQLFHVRRDRRGGAPPRRRHPVLPVRPALLRLEPDPRAAEAGRGQSVGRIREVEARQPRGPRPRACPAG